MGVCRERSSVRMSLAVSNPTHKVLPDYGERSVADQCVVFPSSWNQTCRRISSVLKPKALGRATPGSATTSYTAATQSGSGMLPAVRLYC